MDQDSVERIRSATFNLARRGYDRREVDTFMQRLADWLEGGGDDQAHSEVVHRELERIGQRTAKVLSAAGEAATALKADAEAEANEAIEQARIAANAARVEADRYAERARAEADEYAEAERGKADAYAHERREAAEQTREEAEELAVRIRSEREAEAKDLVRDAKAEAARILDQAQGQRSELEKVIADLAERRDNLIEELEQIAGSLVGTASQHRHPEPATEQLSTEDSGAEPLTEETREASAKRG